MTIPTDGKWYLIACDDRAMCDVSARTTDGITFDVHLRDATGSELVTIPLAEGVTWERAKEVKREALDAAQRRRAQHLLAEHGKRFALFLHPWIEKYL